MLLQNDNSTFSSKNKTISKFSSCNQYNNKNKIEQDYHTISVYLCISSLQPIWYFAYNKKWSKNTNLKQLMCSTRWLFVLLYHSLSFWHYLFLSFVPLQTPLNKKKEKKREIKSKLKTLSSSSNNNTYIRFKVVTQ